ncbi:MAG: UbiX family flavin prenyltransferase [Myxococcales bacterium]|nr:UbiX family flavin prenyltransferase [Myxococcales bacterium]
MKLVVGMSGASGAPYAKRLVELLRADPRVVSLSLVLSRTAATVYAHECGGHPSGLGVPVYSGRDYDAPFASGSAPADAMVVIPASMSTVARIAHGISDDLLTRAADVVLKERRKLIVVPREMPVSAIHLENMLSLTRAGALVLPASPSFYHRPKAVSDLVDTVLDRVRDHLGLPAPGARRWRQEPSPDSQPADSAQSHTAGHLRPVVDYGEDA